MATVKAAYGSFNQGDIPAVLATYDDQIEWIEPGGGSAPSGTFTGPDSVAQDVFATVPENFDEFSVDIDEVEDQGDTVVVKGRFTGKNKSGAVLDAPFEHRNTMRDGKVVRFENKVDHDAWAAAWS
ncbi:MAG: nuclear transport factor 2 family protein [Solirubrobacterales bacterium]